MYRRKILLYISSMCMYSIETLFLLTASVIKVLEGYLAINTVKCTGPVFGQRTHTLQGQMASVSRVNALTLVTHLVKIFTLKLFVKHFS